MHEFQPAIVIILGAFFGALIGCILLFKNRLLKTWSIGGLMVVLGIYLALISFDSNLSNDQLTIALVWLIPILCYRYFKDFLQLDHNFTTSVLTAIVLMAISYGLMALMAIPEYIILLVTSLVGIGYLSTHFRTCYKIYKSTGSSKSRKCVWIWTLHISLLLFYGALVHTAIWKDPVHGMVLVQSYLAVLLVCWAVALMLMPEYLYSLPTTEPAQSTNNQRELAFVATENTTLRPRPKRAKYKLRDDIKKQYLKKILNYMESEKPYLEKNFTINKLSQKLKLSPTYTSRVINKVCGKNFKDFVNGYRIEHACKSLLSDNIESYTIEGIANESGFHSRTAFYNAFKRIKQMAPGEYVVKFGKHATRSNSQVVVNATV